MDSQEDEFFAKLMLTFREEAKEHLKALSDGLLALESNLPANKYKEVIETIFREVHSLKGAARAVNQKTIQDICQSLENVFAAWKRSQIQISAELFDTLHKTVAIMGKALSTKLDSSFVSDMIQQLRDVTEKPNLPKALEQQAVSISTEPLQNETVEKKAKPISESEQKSPENSIRVSLQKLNQLFQEVEETLMIKLFFNQQMIDLKQIMSNLRSQEKNLGFLLSDIQTSKQI